MSQLSNDNAGYKLMLSTCTGSKPTAGSTSAATHDASRPINLNSVGQARHSQYRSSDVSQLGQGASKRSYQEYNQDRISTSEPPSSKMQPLPRPVLERVRFDLHTISNSSENQEPSSKSAVYGFFGLNL
ncbi:hypothetical protein UA08_09443 [Talaromyces atroroseus]|uniref:Uncharacterized protein n=1 Tax=Talaromyces atroroseus TaxID=1441469 RepID=A0A225A561_TALAT|nr:hypothetical protein UA08_09443 [Talaromyces atroroseus]OKL55292.1 hypothetical protein UA08_09443 [Talaromyces atroroseus]